MKIKKTISEYGFTYVEMVIVLSIIILIFLLAIPNFSDLSRTADLSKVKHQIRDALRTAQNNALKGVLSENDQKVFWVVRLNTDVNNSGIEIGPCLELIFSNCMSQVDRKIINLPKYISFSHQFVGYESVNIYFYRITGKVSIFDDLGNLLGDSALITIRSNSSSQTESLTINTDGNIIEQ